jgi:hypothetical protein
MGTAYERYQGVEKHSSGFKLLAAMGWKEGEGLVSVWKTSALLADGLPAATRSEVLSHIAGSKGAGSQRAHQGQEASR